MTITISDRSYSELLQQAKTKIRPDSTDELDLVWQYPSLFGQGIVREIQLREGLFLEIFDCRLRDRQIIENPESWNSLIFHFHLYGHHEDYDTQVNNREFSLYGSGLCPQEINNGPAQTALEVTISLEPKVLISFLADASGKLPQKLQHLVKPSDQIRYARVGKVTPILESILWQILRCPFQGITKRMYLEGKALELISLVIEQEIEIHQDKRSLQFLNTGTIDRIHYAKNILLQNLDSPPSLSELAKQVKLNEYTLKRGFQQVFNTTHNCCRVRSLMESVKALISMV